MPKEIPIFFTTDDYYVPYLDVAIGSLLANASREYRYRIVVLNTGLSPENVATVKERERPGVSIEFCDITAALGSIRERFKNVYHFSIVTYYRLFIASLFPEYDKILYLDCDLIVTGDIAELYQTETGDNILAAVPDQFVCNTEAFRQYAAAAVGVDPDRYFNAGVLLINLKAFREQAIEERFIELITAYDFDLLDPDQAYLNYLCGDKTLLLPNGWNKAPTTLACEGKKNIVHYNLYKKPWQYDDVIDGEYFWQYAADSPFYEVICSRKAAFGEAERQAGLRMAEEILEHAYRIVASEETFVKRLGGNHGAQ